MENNSYFSLLLLTSLMTTTALVNRYYCSILFEDVEAANPDWSQISDCLDLVGQEKPNYNTSAAIWRQTKKIFEEIDFIPRTAYAKLGYVLRAIPLQDLANISMDTVEIVEAFGRVRDRNKLTGFNFEQRELIAIKICNEWADKSAETFSEYDLKLMGPFVCHLSEEIIAGLQAEALKASMDCIGRTANCTRAQALARRAMQSDVFGDPSTWTKYPISKLGSIMYGLTETELAAIDPDLLFYNVRFIMNATAPKEINGTDMNKMTNSSTPSSSSSSSSSSNSSLLSSSSSSSLNSSSLSKN